VALAPAAPPEPDWRSVVSVTEDQLLGRELAGRMRPAGAPRRRSVTDLLAPRPAYWRLTVGAPPLAPERESVLQDGRRLHRILGLVFAPEGALEVRVHDDRVHGRVDVLADRPIEIKTSTYPPPAADPVRERPDHVAQVAIYARLLGTSQARLVYLQTRDEERPVAAVFDLTVDQPASLDAAVDQRVEELAHASRTTSPQGLPRCPWFGRGCEFRGAGVCDCTGEEPPADPLTMDAGVRSEARSDLAGSLATTLGDRLRNAPLATIHRFRDLIYPRRAYFEQTAPPPGEARPAFESETDTFSRLVEALDSGPVGEATRLPTLSDEPDEEVSGFRGDPVLVRTSRAGTRLDPTTVLDRSPQYALQLGFRCVATGTHRARLVLGYERATEAERVQVLEFRFASPSHFSRMWRARTRRLDAARASLDPTLVEPCPAWMFEECPYRDRCGCGAARSQR
jgi:PD-(D/E)XK nuclease superfamily